MTSRERVIAAIEHKAVDTIPLDIGATFATGVSAKVITQLRDFYGLEKRPVRVFDPYQMLGELDNDLINAIGGDVIGLWNSTTLFGTSNRSYKPWHIYPGIELLVGSDFNTVYDEAGNLIAYPRGDKTKMPSGIMPRNGCYFDSIIRQVPYEEDSLTSKSAREHFSGDYPVMDDLELSWLQKRADEISETTDFATIGTLTCASINDFAHLPAPSLNYTPGIRRVDEWLIAHYLHPDYITEIHEMHVESAIENLKLYYEAVGDKIQIIIMSGADYGTQNGLFISKDMYRAFVKPYQKRVNDWVHQNTKWKTWYHSCGSVADLFDDMIEAGVDIINPLQYSAKGMELDYISQQYGGRIVFWGGAIDVQKDLSLENPDSVYSRTLNNLEILAMNNGFIAATTHNIQPNTPIENITAYFHAVKDFRNRNKR